MHRTRIVAPSSSTAIMPLAHPLRAILLSLLLLLVACAAHNRTAFRVLPRPTNDLLQSPDSHQTPFPDVLADYNSFVPGKGWIDLRPLMQLRIENAYYEKGASRKGLQGFLGTEIARYQLDPGSLRLLSMQPMPNRPPADIPVDKLIPKPVLHARLYRLYYEVLYKASNTKGSVLLAADSPAELDQLAAQLDNPESLCGSASTRCASFPEACSVSVEMLVAVNGKDSTILWGSLLESLTGQQPRTVELERLYQGHLVPVQIKHADAAALRLPLLPGDHIKWR